MTFQSVLLVILLLAVTGGLAIDNGVARTPARGFSTWNAFPAPGIDEETCNRYLNAIVKAGLNGPPLNYTYFIVDEPCFVGRSANGSLIENRYYPCLPRPRHELVISPLVNS